MPESNHRRFNVHSLVAAQGGSAIDPLYPALARELAVDIYPVDDIARRYGFNGGEDPRFQRIIGSPEFTNLLQQTMAEWNAADSTLARVRLKSLVVLESRMSELSDMLDPSTPPTTRVAAMTAFMRMGGVDGVKAGAGDGPAPAQPTITINIGPRKVEVKTAPVVEGSAVRVEEDPDDVYEDESKINFPADSLFIGESDEEGEWV